MGISGNRITNEKSQQIINYYIFHKKIEQIINKGNNPYCKNKDIIDIYLINPYWINLWKLYSNYDKVKQEFDKINDENEKSLLNKLEYKCIDLIRDGIINNSDNNYPPSMDNTEFYNIFLELKYIKNDVFDYLIDYQTYKSLFNIYNPLNLLNNFKIKGIIRSKMIILIMEQNYKMKFIYKGIIEGENSLIQLTAHFTLENKFHSFCDKIKTSSSNFIISYFDSKNIGFLAQTKINDSDNSFYFILKNDNLNIKYFFDKIVNKTPENINFLNVNKSIFIGLNNINSPPYLNAVIQNLINIDILTRYFLNENNYTIINNNSYILKFTRFYCELLSIICTRELQFFDLKDFNDIIYIMDSKFKLNIDCIPGDLIKFFLLKINYEFTLFFNKIKINEHNQYINYLNNNIISNFFICIKGTKTECLNCSNININPLNSFLLEFSLDIIYDYYKDKNIQKNADGKYIITLENCFDNYISPLFYKSDDEIICQNCKKKANSKIQNVFYFLPYILIIVVNKEINNKDYIFSFPENLNLESYIDLISPGVNKKDLNYKYKLRGIISHINSDKQKNYLAFCRNRISNEWYKYKDLIIEKCENQFNDLLKEEPDVLIYEAIIKDSNLKTNSKSQISNNMITTFNTNSINYNHDNINRNTLGENIIPDDTKKILNEKFYINFSLNNDFKENNNDMNNNQNIKETKEKLDLFESMRNHMIENNNNNNNNNNNENINNNNENISNKYNDIKLSIINSINSINSNNSSISDNNYNTNKKIELINNKI